MIRKERERRNEGEYALGYNGVLKAKGANC